MGGARRSLLAAAPRLASPADCERPYYRPFRGSREVLRGLGATSQPVRCWSWRCRGCAFLKAKDAQKLARIGIQTALDEGLPLVLLTLTEAAEPRTFEASSAALTQLFKRLQARFGGRLRWFAVAEWQTRGAVHWHAVITGLVYTHSSRSSTGVLWPGHPAERDGWRVRKEADLRPIVEGVGFGPVFDIHAVGVRPQDTAERIASYLAKYLTKNEHMGRVPKGAQPVRHSRGRNQWAPGYTLTSLRDERREAARSRVRAGEVGS